MFCFSVMESSFCFANLEFITVPATNFIDDLGPLRSVQAIFLWKIILASACVLEYDLEMNERVEFVFAGFQTFRERNVWNTIFITAVCDIFLSNYDGLRTRVYTIAVYGYLGVKGYLLYF